MTGVAADAEDLVQQTFERALASPPKGDVRPWLATVAMNLSRDHLRARKRQAYVGPFLPSPIASVDDLDGPIAHEPHADGPPRYEVLESVSYAFLVALEALSPSQRAVLLLRDVFDYSVKETASALSMTEANVKVTHHRARAAMESYEDGRARANKDTMRTALEAFVLALARGDVVAVEKLLRDDVCALTDGGGEYFAARVPIHGAAKVAQFFTKVGLRGGAVSDVRIVELNGSPAVMVRFAAPPAGVAPVSITRVEIDRDGKIAAVHAVLAPRKLTQLT